MQRYPSSSSSTTSTTMKRLEQRLQRRIQQQQQQQQQRLFHQPCTSCSLMMTITSSSSSSTSNSCNRQLLYYRYYLSRSSMKINQFPHCTVDYYSVHQYRTYTSSNTLQQDNHVQQQHQQPNQTTSPLLSTTTTTAATRQSNYQYRDLLRWTENILHPIKTPLGSIIQNVSLWNDIIIAIQVWLGYNINTNPSTTTTTTLASVDQLLTKLTNISHSNNDNDATLTTTTSSIYLESTEPLIPRHVDLVDRLLTRLLYEQSSSTYHADRSHYINNNSIQRYHQSRRYRERQEREQQLQYWMTIVCQAWLTTSRDVPDAPMAVQRALFWYNKMNHTIWNTSTPLFLENDIDSSSTGSIDRDVLHIQQKVPFILEIIRAHQRLVDNNGMYSIRCQFCQTAIDMLLLNNDENGNDTIHTMIPFCTNTPYATRIKECYQLALQQALELVAAESTALSQNNYSSSRTPIPNYDFVSTASQIMERMKQLSELPGWSDIGFQDGELDKVFDALFLDRMKDDTSNSSNGRQSNQKKLSSFERETLQQRILTKINQATTQKDQETVEEMVLYWRSHMHDDDIEKDTLQWKPFAQAVTNFYLRMQDPVKATKWMQIQEQMPSQEALQLLIQRTAIRPSIDISDDSTNTNDDASTSNFAELIALNRVFAENEQERIQQKMNLLDIWITKVRSPSVPWRATEILESLESEKNSTSILTADVYTKVMKLWLQYTNSNEIARQKAFDIGLRCPEIDVPLLGTLINLMVQQREAGENIPPDLITKMIELIQEKFEDIQQDDQLRQTIVLNLFHLLQNTIQSYDVLKFILNAGMTISSDILNAAVVSCPSNIELLLPLLNNNDTESTLQPNSNFYKIAIEYILTETPRNSESMDRVTHLLNEATIKWKMDNQSTADTILDLTYNTMKLIGTIKHQKYAERILSNLETTMFNESSETGTSTVDTPSSNALVEDQVTESIVSTNDLDNSDESDTLPEDGNTEPIKKRAPLQPKVSPIPLPFYKKLIVLFSEKRNAVMVEHIYKRLKEHRAAGYVELHPDQSCCSVYLKVLRELYGLKSLDKRIDEVHELIGRYESSNAQDGKYKPQYLYFDGLIDDLYARVKLRRQSSSSPPQPPPNQTSNQQKEVDPYEKDSRAAVKLLEKMHAFRIAPKNLERVYPFNVAMELVLSCKNQRMHYKVVTDLKKQLDDLGIVSNSYTMSLILKSCERAVASKNFAALTTMVQCLTDLRQMGKAHPAVYVQCFKIFQLKRSLSQRETVLAEKMMGTVFKCCIDDGMLINPIRYHFKALAGPATFQQYYTDLLLDDGTEPKEWIRNVTEESLNSRQSNNNEIANKSKM